VSSRSRIRNPFTYGDLAADDSFTDRADELAQLTADARNGQNVAVIAPRRYGKSSLVKAALRDLIGEGFLVVEVDLMTTPTKERLAAKLAKSIHDDVATPLFRAKERLRIFGSLRIVPAMNVDTHGVMSFGFSATRSASDIDETIERLLELPAEIAADKRRRLVVSFDEFQEITQIDPRLPALMRAVFQHQPDVAHLYAGSRRDMMRRLFSDAHEPFYRSAKTMEIGPIAVPLFAEFVKAQFDRTDRGVSDEAVDGLLAVTGGHPYATQELAYALWEDVPEGFTGSAGDLADALRAVLRAESARFTLIWETSTRPQKLLLQALAREPGRPFSNPYRLRHDLPPSSGVQRALRPLLDAELVRKEEDGHYDLAEPFLREWILAYAI
jgi:AAA+ ATPase superfamily predicted ATPase